MHTKPLPAGLSTSREFRLHTRSTVSSALRACLPDNLIGSPINYVNRLIGFPITSQSTDSQYMLVPYTFQLQQAQRIYPKTSTSSPCRLLSTLHMQQKKTSVQRKWENSVRHGNMVLQSNLFCQTQILRPTASSDASPTASLDSPCRVTECLLPSTSVGQPVCGVAAFLVQLA